MKKEELLAKLLDKNQLSPFAINEMTGEINKFGAAHPEFLAFFNRLSDLPGNAANYGVENTPTIQSPLAGKRIAFLGSSVTFGFGSLGESFVDYLAKRDGIVPLKEAVSGTTLIDQDTFSKNDSYVARLKKIDRNAQLDAFVLQLSTNDAKTGKEDLGTITDGDYDVQTITGAIEYILNYIRKTWAVPVFIYTNPRYENDFYQQMVNQLQPLQDKWHFKIIDLFNSPAFDYSPAAASLYRLDDIHPTRAGYQLKWLPFFEQQLIK